MPTITRDLSVDWGTTGATLYYSVIGSDGSTLIARTSTDVVESPSESGLYHVVVSTWDVGWVGRVIWDDGTDSAVEQFDRMPAVASDVPTAAQNAAAVKAISLTSGETLDTALGHLSLASGGVKLADGVAHGGSTATLRLGSSSGYALFVQSSANGYAGSFFGGGAGGSGSYFQGGLNAAGIYAAGAGTGYGIDAVGASGIVGTATADEGAGILGTATVNGDKHGIRGVGRGDYAGGISGTLEGSIHGDIDGKVLGGGTSPIAGTGVRAEPTSGTSTNLASGTVVSTTGTTTTLDSGTVATANFYVESRLVITGGTGAGQWRVITGYSASRVTQHAAWTTSPDNTSTYAIREGPAVQRSVTVTNRQTTVTPG